MVLRTTAKPMAPAAMATIDDMFTSCERGEPEKFTLWLPFADDCAVRVTGY